MAKHTLKILRRSHRNIVEVWAFFNIIHEIVNLLLTHLKTLICKANKMTGFYIECSTGSKWVKK